MTDNLPLYVQYRIAAMDWCDKEASASILEDLKSNVMASMMGDLMVADPKMAINRAEQCVKASPEWEYHVISIVDARKAANVAKIQVEYLKMRFQQYMSEEANNRTEARL